MFILKSWIRMKRQSIITWYYLPRFCILQNPPLFLHLLWPPGTTPSGCPFSFLISSCFFFMDNQRPRIQIFGETQNIEIIPITLVAAAIPLWWPEKPHQTPQQLILFFYGILSYDYWSSSTHTLIIFSGCAILHGHRCNISYDTLSSYSLELFSFKASS